MLRRTGWQSATSSGLGPPRFHGGGAQPPSGASSSDIVISAPRSRSLDAVANVDVRAGWRSVALLFWVRTAHSGRARVKPSPARPFCSANTGRHRTGEYCACKDGTRCARSLLRVPLGRRRQTRRCQPAQRARTGHESLCRIGSARRRTRCVRPRSSRGQARWRGALGGAPPKTRPRPASHAAASPLGLACATLSL